MADEFVQRDIPPGKDCNDYPTWGSGSPRYDYIFKGQADEGSYPEDACPPWYHATAQIDGLKINSPVLQELETLILLALLKDLLFRILEEIFSQIKRIFHLICPIPIKRDGDFAMSVLKVLRLLFTAEERFLQMVSSIFHLSGMVL